MASSSVTFSKFKDLHGISYSEERHPSQNSPLLIHPLSLSTPRNGFSTPLLCSSLILHSPLAPPSPPPHSPLLLLLLLPHLSKNMGKLRRRHSPVQRVSQQCGPTTQLGGIDRRKLSNLALSDLATFAFASNRLAGGGSTSKGSALMRPQHRR